MLDNGITKLLEDFNKYGNKNITKIEIYGIIIYIIYNKCIKRKWLFYEEYT